MRTHQRVRDHINNAYSKTGREGDHVFLPQWRMRQIRWEEDIVRARANREGRGDLVVVNHMDCCCGSIECLRTPIDRGKLRRAK